jgi:DNA-binding transcriptional LysR family regulator
LKKKDFLALKLKELSIFQTVGKLSSLREAARVLNLSASEVSKCISGIEDTLGTELFKRISTGLVLTEAGQELLIISESILSETQKIELLFSEKFDGEKQKSMVIASSTFLTNVLVAPEIMKWRKLSGNDKDIIRFIDLTPDDLLVAAGTKSFELAVHLNELKLPNSWYSQKIGRIGWSLYASASHPLFEGNAVPGKKFSLESILKFKFVIPAYYDKLGFHTATDNFPVPVSKRQIGATTSTAESAIHCIKESHFIAHLPNILARNLASSEDIVAFGVHDFEEVFMLLYLSAQAEKVSKQIFQKLLEVLGSRLV